MEALLKKIEAYGFECEGGPLPNCEDWQRLRNNAAELERQLADIRTKHEVACSTLEIVKEQRTAAQKALALQCKETKHLRQQLAASADKTAATVQPVGEVVMYPNYSTVVHWLPVLPPAGTKLYAAPRPQAAQSEDSKRLDWLEQQPSTTLHHAIDMPNTISESRSSLIVDYCGNELGRGADLRAAIDAALAQAGKEGA